MNKITQTIKISQKPIDFDIFLKYICPSCQNDHWIKYLAATTKNFKVVCDCGTVFKIKRIYDFKLKFAKKNKEKKSNQIPDDLLKESIRILCEYGFDREEAKALVEKAYIEHPAESVSELVKQSLVIERNNNE